MRWLQVLGYLCELESKLHKGGYIGIIYGITIGDTRGDTRSLDSSSCTVSGVDPILPTYSLSISLLGSIP